MSVTFYKSRWGQGYSRNRCWSNLWSYSNNNNNSNNNYFSNSKTRFIWSTDAHNYTFTVVMHKHIHAQLTHPHLYFPLLYKFNFFLTLSNKSSRYIFNFYFSSSIQVYFISYNKILTKYIII